MSVTQATIWGMLKDRAQNNILDLVDSSAPTNGTSGTGATIAGPGSTYVNFSTGDTYVNFGTLASPLWVLIDGAGTPQQVSGTITSANITGTSASQLGHANGFIMVPAAPTGFINVLIQATINFIFATAAYTGGGNITVNIGGGGAALTGLISAANSLLSASSKFYQAVPLATAFNAYTDANSINLVSAAAPTQPGTAAGVVKYRVTFMTHPNT